MKSVVAFPPNYDAICAAIPGVIERNNVVFTYGDTIYNPYNGAIEDHLDVHESVHMQQQFAIGVETWWDKYLSDTKFRLEQEVEAYSEQYRFVSKVYGLEPARGLLRDIATDLSSAMYGNILDRKQARKAIIKK